MAANGSTDAAPSLVGITLRRSVVVGRIYLGLGLGFSMFYGIILSLVGGNAFATTEPLLLPIFGVLGSFGALLVFTNDRIKGVFEYLLAYGVTTRQLFGTFLAVTLVIAAVVLGLSGAAALAIFVARGHTISPLLAELLVFYTVPMTFVTVAFAATIGMVWTSLSSPREGMNGPLGLLPIFGVGPTALGLIVVEAALTRGSPPFYVASTALLVIIAGIVVALLATLGRFLSPERLLSPA